MTPWLVAGLLLARPAVADELAVGAYVGHFAASPGGPQGPDHTWGFRVRWGIDDRWSLAAAAGAYGEPTDPRLELQYYLEPRPEANLRPFLAAGWGAFVIDQSPHDLWEGGVGLNAALFPTLDWRSDLRYRVLHVNMDTEGGFYAATGIELHAPRVQPPPPPPPDLDHDGLIDSVDACPAEPEDADGFGDGDGCPDPDNDGDGVLDGFDQCGFEMEDSDGFQDADGCPDPDNDGDGIPDSGDNCPNEPEVVNGWRDKDGCADELPAEVRRFAGRIEGVKFDTGKATIKKESFKVLDAAAAVLTQFPEVRLEVQGHTDDVGDDAKNLDLSQRRAQAVVDYLVSKGVAADRLVAKGYGETKPEVPNDSTENRARNRRVEFLVLK